MLRFQYPNLLAALVLLPILLALFAGMLYWRRKKIKQIGTPNLVQEQILGFIPMRQSLKFILLSTALLLLIIGTANLQKSGSNETVQRKGVDVMIALDVSKSMLAKDIQPDRLTRAKQFISRLSDKMTSDRVGLIIFAGRSYVQVPLTVDYSALKFLLQTVSPDMVPTQGTVIGDAIDMATQSFSSKERKYKSIIVLSDGEDHDATALEKVKIASEQGVIVHTIGIGSPQGATLYDPNTNAPKLDEQGNPVVSKLNETELKNIAAAGNGSYILLGNTETAATKIVEALSSMEQRNLGAVVYTNYISYFQYFLLAAFVLIMLEWLIAGARKTKTKQLKNVGKSLSIVALAIGMSSNAAAQSALKKGNQLYDAGKYKEAASEYGKAIKQDTAQLQKSSYNLGNALYQQKQIDNARKAYDLAAQKAKHPNEKANAQYNTGNTYMSERKWEEAIEAYKKTLRNNPQDQDAKYNLSYAKAMLQKEQQDKKKNKKKEDKKEEQKKEDKKKEEQQNKQGQQNKNEQGQQQQQEQEQQSKLSQQQAEQLLNALQQEEKKLQEQKKKMHGAPTRMAKDW